MHKIGSMGPLRGPGSKGSEGSEGSEDGGGGFAAGCVEGLWKKVLKIDRPLAGGFLSLTGPSAPRVVVAASPQIKKGGARLRRGLCRRVMFASLRGRRPFGPRVAVAASPQIIKKPARALPSFRPKRSGVEKSPPHGTGGITVGDLSTQSIMGAFSLCPIPTCGSARDDGAGGQHPVIKKRGEPHSRHFDRSEADWKNLTPQMTEKPVRPLPSFRPKRSGVEKSHSTMVHEALRWEISRLRAS